MSNKSELTIFVIATIFCAAGALWGWLGGSCTNLDPCTGVRNCTENDGCFGTWVFTLAALIGALAVWTEVRERLKK